MTSGRSIPEAQRHRPRLTITLSRARRDQLVAEAAREGVTVSEFAERLIAAGLPELPADPAPKRAR